MTELLGRGRWSASTLPPKEPRILTHCDGETTMADLVRRFLRPKDRIKNCSNCNSFFSLKTLAAKKMKGSKNNEGKKHDWPVLVLELVEEANSEEQHMGE